MPITAPHGLRYGALGFPLAFVALPLTVHLPEHVARQYGVPLAALGGLLLAVRAGDALTDPLLGRWADKLLRRPQRTALVGAMGLAALVLALCLLGLLQPPEAVWQGGPLLTWIAVLLATAYLAYSFLMVTHQAWGTALGSDTSTRARVVAWREGAALLGVVVASVLPSVFGLAALPAVLAVALLVALLMLWANPPPAPGVSLDEAPWWQGLWSPWQDPRFSRLMLIYGLNGVASAIPATLLLFFLRDRLQAPEAQAWCLGLYFLAATASLPIWVRLVGRLGLARAWLLGMLMAIAAFVGASSLGPGELGGFGVICLASGLALGADITAAPALLAGLRPNPAQHPGSADAQAGLRFGWWNLATKLNLALAAGLALPALQWLGYQPGQATPQGVQALAWMYGLLPCVLKGGAALLLYRIWIRKDTDHEER